MKALCIKEPWASIIRRGEKTIETRTWKTKYRGKILLCCSKRPDSMISGFAFATADLVDCRKMTRKDEYFAQCETYPKANSWVFENINPIQLFPVKGQLGLFEIDIEDRKL